MKQKKSEKYLLDNGWKQDTSFRKDQWTHPKTDGWGCLFPLSEAVKMQKSWEKPVETLFNAELSGSFRPLE